MTKAQQMSIPERYSKKYIKELTDIILREYGKPCPIDPIEIAESYGLKVLEGEFERPDVSGMLDMNTLRIIVAQGDSYLRKRFSIAHEFGHFILHYHGKKPENDIQPTVSYRDGLSSMGFDIKEMEANFFAANLLMPSDKVEQLCNYGYNAEEVAEYFAVSKAAALNRMGFVNRE